MLHINPLNHITTQTSISFLAVPRQHARQPLHVRSCYKLLQPPPSSPSLPPPPREKRIPNLVVHRETGQGKGMNWFYEIEEEVREYELDQFGVVNNAVYSNYGEFATYKLLDSIGFDPNIKLAASDVSIKYISPLQRKDRFVMKVRVYDYSTTRFYFEQLIFKLPNHQPILRGTATLVHLDEKLRPSRITPSMISKFHKFILSANKSC